MPVFNPFPAFSQLAGPDVRTTRRVPHDGAVLLAATAVSVLAGQPGTKFRFDCADPSHPDAALLKCHSEHGGEQIVAIWPRALFGPLARFVAGKRCETGADCLRIADCAFPSTGGVHGNRRFPMEIAVERHEAGRWQIRAILASTWRDVEPLIFQPVDIGAFLSTRDRRHPGHAGKNDTTGVLFSNVIDAERMDGQLLPGLFGDSVVAGRARFGFDAALMFHIVPAPEPDATGAITMTGMPGSFETLVFRMTDPDGAPGLRASLHGYRPSRRLDDTVPAEFAVGGWPTGGPLSALRIRAMVSEEVLAAFGDGEIATRERARSAVTAVLSHQGAPQKTVATLRWQPAAPEIDETFGALVVDWQQAGGIRSETRIRFAAFEIRRNRGAEIGGRGVIRYRLMPASHAAAVTWQDASFAVSALHDPMGESGAEHETLIEIGVEEADDRLHRLTAFSARLALHAARVQTPKQKGRRSGLPGQRPPPLRVQFVGADVAFWLPVLGPPPAFSGGALVPLGPPATEGLMAHVSLERAKAGSLRRINLISSGAAVSGVTLNAFRRVPGHTEVRLVTASDRRQAYSGA